MGLKITTSSSLNDIAEAVYQNAVEHGFHDDLETEEHFIERACNNLHDEVSELHEAWRNKTLHEACDKSGVMMAHSIRPLTCAEEELADIIIRAADNARKLGIDIQSAVMRKHAFNITRPFRHGGKLS